MLALAASVLALAAPATALDDRADLRRARARWARQHVRDYRYRLQVGCFCPKEVLGPHRIRVRRGRPVRTRRAIAPYDTIPDLFEVIDDALDGRAAQLDVRYDRRLGYPRSISVNHRADTADDELTITVDRFAR